jgi:hypothetical protein
LYVNKKDGELCNNIECMSNGVCAIRPILPGGKTYQSKCLCRAGSDGEYCEKQSKRKKKKKEKEKFFD